MYGTKIDMENRQIPWTMLIHHFQGVSSETEEQQLTAWLAEASHASLYASLQALWQSIQQEGETWQSDADRLWQRLEQRINPQAEVASPVLQATQLTAKADGQGAAVRGEVQTIEVQGNVPADKIRSEAQPKEVRIPLGRFRYAVAAAALGLLLSVSAGGYAFYRWVEASQISHTFRAMNGKSRVTLPDGTKVWLNADTKLTYESSFWSKERAVKLEGEALFEVMPDQEHPFIVKNYGFRARVYGTRFLFKARKELPQVHVALISGSVAVQSTGDEHFLNPGEGALCNRTTGDISVRQTDVMFHALWAGESIRIEGKSLPELVPTLQCWYGVKIRLDDTIGRNQAYTFTIHNEPLEEILRLMARIHPIEYAFDDKNQVTITNKVLTKKRR